MAKIVKGARFVSKYANSKQVKPTIPINDDHTTGWKTTDIYVGEWFFNIFESKAYFRTDDGIFEVVTVQSKKADGTTADTTNTKISASYLPGNYMGAMLYKGTWNAKKTNGQHPGGDAVPQNGDYYVVNEADSNPNNNTTLNGINDWGVGDFAVYTNLGEGWQKIDNTERRETADIVDYSNKYDGRTESYFDTKTTVQTVLDNIYENLYKTPNFNNLSTFNKGIKIYYPTNNPITTSDLNPLLNIQGNPDNVNNFIYFDGHTEEKWITYNGEVGGSNFGSLKIGVYGNTNNVLEIGPFGANNVSLTNTVNYNYSIFDTQIIRRKRWNIFSSSSDGYIKGYSDNGTTEIIKLSTKDDSFINKKLAVGIGVNNALGDLQVNSNNTSTKLVISRTTTTTTSNLEIGSLSFNSSPNTTTYTEHAKIVAKIADTTSTSSLIFYIKGPNGDLLDGLVLKGTTTGYYLGVNKGTGINPTVPLDVTGDALITGKLTLSDLNYTHLVNGYLSLGKDLTINGNILSVKTNDSNIFTIKDLTNSYLNLYWTYGNKTLNIKGSGGSTHIQYNTTSGYLTLSTNRLNLSNTDLYFTGNVGKTVDFNYALVDKVVFKTISFNDIVGYNNSYTYDNFASNHLINKQSLTDYVASHAVGLWSTGSTFDQYVAYDLGQMKQIGINIFNPLYNLDVVGNARISSNLLATNIILNSNLQERFIRTDVYGGAIRFRGNNDSNTDRNLKLGSIDGSNVFTDVVTINTDTYNVGIGTGVNTLLYKLSVDGKIKASDNIITSAALVVGNLAATPYDYGLYVQGNSFFNSNVGIKIDTDPAYSLTVSGDTHILGDINISDGISVQGISIFNDKVSIKGNNVNTDLFVNGNSYVSRLNINNTTNFSSYLLNVNGNAYIEKQLGLGAYNSLYKLYVAGITYTNSLHINSTSTSTGYKLVVDGDIKASNMISFTSINYYLRLDNQITSLRVPGKIYTNAGLVVGNLTYLPNVGGLYVQNDSTFDSSLTINNMLNVYGESLFNNTVSVSGDTYITGFLNVGDYTLDPTHDYKLVIAGKGYFNNDVTIDGSLTVNTNLNINNNAYFTNNVGIGTTPNINYKLNVNGISYIKSLNKNKVIKYISYNSGMNTDIYFVEGNTFNPSVFPEYIDNLSSEDYVLYIRNLTTYNNILFQYKDIEKFTNRNFKIIINLEETIDTNISFQFIKMENGATNVDFNIELPISGSGPGVVSKSIIISFTFYDIFFIDSLTEYYKQVVVWESIIYGNDNVNNTNNLEINKYGNASDIFFGYSYSWTRVGTLITVNAPSHGLDNNTNIHIYYSTDNITIPNNNYTITKISNDVFTINGINNGSLLGKIVLL